VPEVGVDAAAEIPAALQAALLDLPNTAATFDDLLDGVRAWATRGKRKLGAFNVTGNLDGTLDKYSKVRVALPAPEIRLDCHEIVFEDGAWTARDTFMCEEMPAPRCKIRQVLAKGPTGKPDATRGVWYRKKGSWTLLAPNDQGLTEQVYDDDCEVEVERP
jgi:hypothetical protein